MNASRNPAPACPGTPDPDLVVDRWADQWAEALWEGAWARRVRRPRISRAH
ncbi:hypothetical protein XYCOK13_26210 [Xylanibacillus composti]|uniref:Uncharacterized protein n=1 Tax=Xylanibacillus composti TaxID=1572762 RepID=A0A8J4H2J9_9BACL|nr:hypothetical protein XYCOK13_26210 [Xylanibacillus composti]